MRAVLPAFFPSFLAFLALGLLVSPSPVWAFLYYVGLGPLTLAVLWRARQAPHWRDPLIVLLLITIVWFALTLTWGVNQSPALVRKYANAAVTNSVFLVGGILFFHADNKDWRERAFAWLPLVAATNVLVSLFRHYVWNQQGLDVRLLGWAETRQEILGASIIAVLAVMALRNLVVERLPAGGLAGRRAVQAGCLALCLLFILLSGSRGPMLAMLCGGGVFLLLTRPRWLLPVPVLAGSVLLVLYLTSAPALLVLLENLQRPSLRGEIWADVLRHAADRPLVGFGLASVGSFGRGWITFPHSMYFSALYYGGAIGLALVVAVFAVVLWRVVRLSDRTERAFMLALLAIPLVSGLTDTGQFIKPPSPQWYIVWLPLIVATALTLRKAETKE